MKKNFKFINIFVIVVLLFTITSCTYEKTPNTESNHIVKYENINITDFNQMLEVAIDKASYSSVAIIASKGGIFSSSSLGSGVVIGKNGTNYYALTNRHVIEFERTDPSKTNVKVFFSANENDYVDGTVLVYDKQVDIAVIGFTTTKNISIATISNQDTINKGSICFAYGSPYDLSYFGTATLGIVSYESRVFIDEMYNSNTEVENLYIQHDAAINSGNSGGGLFDIYGNLVGINTLKLVGDDNEIDGIGFAIPIEVIKGLTNFNKYFVEN